MPGIHGLGFYVKNKRILNDPRFLELIREMNLPDPAPLTYDPEL